MQLNGCHIEVTQPCFYLHLLGNICLYLLMFCQNLRILVIYFNLSKYRYRLDILGSQNIGIG